MTNVITVEGLSKSYLIAHQRKASYATLRETVMHSLRGAGSRLAGAFSGRERQASGREEFWALDNVNFEVKSGESIGIIGRNGAGKSTLLKILSRITEPTRGRARIRGRLASLLEVGTGFHPELTGRENVFLNGAILGMGKREIQRKFDEIVAFSGVEKFLDTPVKHFSSGMHVRLAFSVAAHLEPDILIVDEVLSVGDLDFQKKCLGKMRDTASEGRTVLCVSHDLSAISRICDRTILLSQGVLLADGPTDQVIRTYISLGREESQEYVQANAPEKAINLRKVTMRNREDEASLEFKYDEGIDILVEYEVNAPVRDCAVWFGIRTMEEIVAFGSSDSDVDASLLGVRAAGYYRTVVNLPAKWLNAGKYFLVVGITRYSPLENFDRVEACTFSILDVGTPERMRTGHSRPGVLQPYLAWNTEAGPTVVAPTQSGTGA